MRCLDPFSWLIAVDTPEEALQTTPSRGTGHDGADAGHEDRVGEDHQHGDASKQEDATRGAARAAKEHGALGR